MFSGRYASRMQVEETILLDDFQVDDLGRLWRCYKKGKPYVQTMYYEMARIGCGSLMWHHLEHEFDRVLKIDHLRELDW